MPFPDDPLAFCYEFFVGNNWVDISSDIDEVRLVTLTRGWQEESKTTATDPSKAGFQLYNDTGNYSPANPEGLWHGSLDVNTPMRITLGRGADAFGRVVSNGLGSSDWGQPWLTPKGSGGTVAAANYAVNGSAATISVPTVGGWRFAVLDGPELRNVEVCAQATIPVTNITGAAVWPISVLLRGVSDTDWVYAGASINTDETVSVGIYHYDGTVIAASQVVPGLVHTAAQALIVRGQAEGHSFRAKVWAAGTAEPYDWQVDGHFTRNDAPGWIGVMALVATGNTNVMPMVSTIDNVTVRVPRFHGELSDLRVRWDESEESMRTHVVAQGIRRRLGQGATPLLSPARRRINHILGTSVGQPYIRQWWPLEDEAGATSLETISPAANSSGRFYGGGTQLTVPGGATDAPGAPRAITVNNGGDIYLFPQDNAALATAWGAAWALKVEPGKSAEVFLYCDTDDTGWRVRVKYWSNGIVQVYFDHVLGAGTDFLIMGVTVRSGGWSVSDWHHYIVTARNNGANVDFTFWVDGAQVATATRTSTAVRAITQMSFAGTHYSGTPELGPYAASHAMILTGHPGTWHADTADAIADSVMGHRGERAGRRIERLLAEELINFDYIGNLDDTEPMGPQPTDTVLKILDQCADADQGVLTDPVGTLGFLYRTRISAYHQLVTLTLDYVAGQLDPPLEPARDDTWLRNDIRVGRSGGAPPVRAQLLTGRKSVLPPHQGGSGRYDEAYTLNLYIDGQAVGIAWWKLGVGTQEGTRYPRVTLDLSTEQIIAAGLTDGALDMDIFDLMALVNMFKKHDPKSARLLLRGYTETQENFVHKITFTCMQEGPFNVAVVDAADNKVDSANSTITGGPYAPGVTTISVLPTSGPWVTGAVTLDLDIGGEEVRATNITGTSPQTFTVLRSRNGVSKQLNNGTRVRLARPVKVGLRKG